MAGDWLAPALSGFGAAIVTAIFAMYRENRAERRAHEDAHGALESRLADRIDDLGDDVRDRIGAVDSRLAGVEGVCNALLGYHETPAARAARKRRS